MTLERLERKNVASQDLWFFGEDCQWMFSKHKELIRAFLTEEDSFTNLDTKFFNVNGKMTGGWISNGYLKQYLGVKDELRKQLRELGIERAINELKSQDDEDYNELIQLLEEVTLESNIVDNFLNNVFWGKDKNDTKEKYNILKGLIEKEKNIIIQGPSGVGKNYVAKNLADSISIERDSEFVEIIRFHENYFYDYFVESPSNQGKKGIFYNFCQKAIEKPNHSFFFIIDDIDKGNISQIFGELFSLIDKDKRGDKYKIPLFYSQESFSVPENVHIIGLLNTSNRSSLTTDYAFRRKFSFFDLKPGFNSMNFEKYMKLDEFKNTHFKKVINKIKELNIYIEKDESLGPRFCIGHSYFCNLEHNGDVNQQLKCIIQFKIIPLLKEYWFDEPEKVQYWETELFSSLGITI